MKFDRDILTKDQLLLYAVTDSHWLNGSTLHSVVKESLEDKIIGVSAQTVEQAILAEKHGADYLGVGAVFPTGSKDDATEVPHETLKAICEAVSIPVIAIGGITQENVSTLAGSGICGIAVISAIYAQPDIRKAAQDLKIATAEMVKA